MNIQAIRPAFFPCRKENRLPIYVNANEVATVEPATLYDYGNKNCSYETVLTTKDGKKYALSTNKEDIKVAPECAGLNYLV